MDGPFTVDRKADQDRIYLLTFDLQLFGEEKTEAATPKKKQDARKKGQVLMSRDISSVISLLLGFIALNALGPYLIKGFIEYYLGIMNAIELRDDLFNVNALNQLFIDGVSVTLKLTLPIMLVLTAAGVIGSYIQVGFLFTLEPLKPDFNKINPLSGFKRLFSMKSIAELFKSTAKGVLIGVIVWLYVRDRQEVLVNLMNLDYRLAAVEIWKMTFDLVMRICVLLVVLGIMDYFYRSWEFEKDLRMSKKEIKEEYKLMEGDPMLKSKIKEKQRSLAMSRMMQEVPKADVVITNPTHFAIALRYNTSEENAPKVLAKGQDLVAMRIRQMAEENGIPLVENKPLAQALYKEIDIGALIPAHFYEAVAEVLAYVYSLKNKK